MVMAANAADSNASGQIEKSKPASGENTTVQAPPDGRPQQNRVQQADLSGFIGGDVWMVGKYER